ncbi:MAG TPA: phage holin family protein [Bryobacteraceae bacterium]
MNEQDSGQPNWETDARSLKDIVQDIVRDIGNIFRAELRLAGAELKEKFRKGAIPGGMLVAAGLLGFFAMACFIATCIVALTIVLDVWLSILLMGVLLAIVAGGAFLMGRMALEQIDPVPQQTLETMKDNVEWAKNRLK